MIRRALVVGALLVAGLPGLVTSTPAGGAPAAAPGACTTAEGVTIVISFNELRGGQTLVFCAPNSPTSGFDALNQAGVTWQSTLNPAGFMCRIDGLPAGGNCNRPPPASEYWSYWLAPRGGAWCYSNLGAGGRRPPAGTVEGWSFSLNRTTAPAPGLSPPPPIPGVAPSPIPASHCTTPTTNPGTTVPRPPAPTTPPAPPRPTPTQPPTPPAGGGGSGGSDSGTGGRPDGGDGGGSGGEPGRSDPGAGDGRGDDALGPGSGQGGSDDASTAGGGGEGDEADAGDEAGEDDGDDPQDDDGDGDDATRVAADDEAAAVEKWEEQAEAAAGDRAASGSDDDGGGGSPLALVLAVVLIAVLGVGGFLRNRRTWTA